MKTYMVVILISLFGLNAYAQADRKLRNDVTYSTSNYKHPNKAAIARQWSADKGTTVTAPGTVAGPVANYKQPMNRIQPIPGLVVPHTPEMDVAVRNYKIQRVSQPRTIVTELAAKPQSSTEVSGD